MMAGDRFRNAAYYTRQDPIKEMGTNIADWYPYAKNVKRTMPDWATAPQWIEMCKAWDTESWRDQSKKNTGNRASAKGTFSGGSLTMVDKRKKMVKEKGRDVSFLETFKETKTDKKTGAYIDKKAVSVVENYTQTMSESYGDTWETDRVDDPAGWAQAAGGLRHGRLYGCGSMDNTRKIRNSSSSGSASASSHSQHAASSNVHSQIDALTTLVTQQAQMMSQQQM